MERSFFTLGSPLPISIFIQYPNVDPIIPLLGNLLVFRNVAYLPRGGVLPLLFLREGGTVIENPPSVVWVGSERGIYCIYFICGHPIF